MPMSEFAQAVIVATLAKILPALGEMVDGTDSPFAEKVRNLRPSVWPTDLEIKRLTGEK